MTNKRFKELKQGDWILIENVCSGWSKNAKTNTLSGSIGPFLVEVLTAGPGFLEYRRTLSAESSSTGVVTKRQVICKVPKILTKLLFDRGDK